MKRLSGEFANSINKPFLEPLEEYCPFRLITCLALEKDLPKFLLGSIQERCLEVISYSNLVNCVGLTGFRIGFFENSPTLWFLLYAEFSMYCLKSNAYLDRGNLLM